MIEWTKELDIELHNAVIANGKKWSKISKTFSVPIDDPEVLRTRWRSSKHADNVSEFLANGGETDPIPLKQTQEILASGAIKVDKLLTLDGDRSSDLIGPEELMLAHGIDFNKMELTSSKMSNWQVLTRDEGVQTLVQSSITVKPRKQFVDWDVIKKHVSDAIEPSTPRHTEPPYSDRNLVVHLTDLHFGNAVWDDYKDYLDEISHRMGHGYKKILIACTGDILNEDNYDGTTRSGTQIGKTDMTGAWLDAFRFLGVIIEHAHLSCGDVELIYTPGNHDWFSGHTVILALSERFKHYSSVDIHTAQDTFTATTLDDVMIAVTHGDRRNVKEYPNIFASMFPEMWGRTKTRECLIGHLHHAEHIVKGHGGMTVRRSPSRSPEDDFHKDNGYCSPQEFTLYEYSTDRLKTTYHI